MSPADSILTILLAESRTILFFLVLSTMVSFSEPCLSSVDLLAASSALSSLAGDLAGDLADELADDYELLAPAWLSCSLT